MEQVPQKRAYPFPEAEERIGTPPQKKVAETPSALNHLSPADREAVERTAALLNIPVALLLQASHAESQRGSSQSQAVSARASRNEQAVQGLSRDSESPETRRDEGREQGPTSDTVERDMDSYRTDDLPSIPGWVRPPLGPYGGSWVSEYLPMGETIRPVPETSAWVVDYDEHIRSLPALSSVSLESPPGRVADIPADWSILQHNRDNGIDMQQDTVANQPTPNADVRTISSTDSTDDPQGRESPVVVEDTTPWGDTTTPRSLLEVITSDWTFIEQQERDRSPAGENQPNAGSALQLVQWNPKHRSSATQHGRRVFDPRSREETTNTRKLKACVRCRMQRIRCNIDENDPSGVCRTCQNVSNAQKIYSLPCVRYRLTECQLYRIGKGPGLEFTFRWPTMKLKDINKWASPKVRSIHVKSNVCPVPFELSVRRFVPIPQDSLHRAWMDGKVKKFKETAPYGIVNMETALAGMREYVTNTTFETLDYCLQNTDELVKLTYDFARKYMHGPRPSDEKRLMGNYLRLWAALHRTITTEHIVGDDKLDMEPELVDRSYPLFGKVPLPPVMIQQLDMILTLGILNPLQKQVLEDFQKIVQANKPKSWLTVYLLTFMSLQTCARMTDENYRNARKHGLRRRYSIPNFIQDRHHAANVFLAYYHYCTQPCDPLKLDWKRRQATPFADMSPEDVLFIKRTRELVDARQDEIRLAREAELYEHDLYFVSQMYEDGWSPRDTVIDFDDGTIHDVPLRKFYGQY